MRRDGKYFPLRLSHVIPLGVATMLAIVIALASVAYFAISATRDRVQGLAQYDYVMLISALEMQVSISAMTISNLEFAAAPELVKRERVLKSIADFNRQLTRYRDAAEGNSKHTDFAAKVAELFKQYEADSLSILERRGEEENLLARIFRGFKKFNQRVNDDLAGNIDLRSPFRQETLQAATQLEAGSAQIIAQLSEFLRIQNAPAREAVYREISAFNTKWAAVERLRIAPDKRLLLAEIKTQFGAGVRDIQALLEVNAIMTAQRAANAGQHRQGRSRERPQARHQLV